jgi:hypothetical protein
MCRSDPDSSLRVFWEGNSMFEYYPETWEITHTGRVALAVLLFRRSCGAMVGQPHLESQEQICPLSLKAQVLLCLNNIFLPDPKSVTWWD